MRNGFEGEKVSSHDWNHDHGPGHEDGREGEKNDHEWKEWVVEGAKRNHEKQRAEKREPKPPSREKAPSQTVEAKKSKDCCAALNCCPSRNRR